jgi:signal transduction histidine kinase/CheY-like chemotaxis protein
MEILMSMRLLRVSLARDADVVTARQRARQLAALLRLESQDQTRLATAVSEIARNAVEHGRGGVAEFSLVGTCAPQLLEVRISDEGPGIEDLAGVRGGRHLSPGGLGVGLAGAERLVDRFEIETHPGRGTHVTLSKLLPDCAPLVDPTRVRQLTEELARAGPEGAVDELKRQNRELMLSLEEVRRRSEELLQVNRELDDTNRGVVALYAELDEKAEHLKRADELKTRFLSNMTHEFRTPLNSILALSRFLEDEADGPLTPEQRRQVGFIRKSAGSLSELVEDLLDLAKVAAGKTVVRPAEFRIAELFGALRGMLRPLLVSPRVQLEFEDASQLPPIYGDENKVSQIVRNFISNALKFTEAGEVRVSAHLDEAAQRFTIAVKDTGIGISPEHHTRVFEEFSQLDSPLQCKVKGTGLGLPLSKRLAELMGGSVSLRSALGKGSTFSVTLPVRFEEAVAKDAAEFAALEPGRIPLLVVEDNPAEMAFYEAVLRHSPYQLLKAESTAQARRVLLQAQPRAVILDILLGEEQGWKLLADLKRTPELSGVPIIVVSTVDDPAKAAALGADAWAHKPVASGWLLETLGRLVRGTPQPRVLIIDDDEISRYLIRQYLAGCHTTVMEASSGASGLEAALRSRPDLILLDINMPDRSGYSVLDELARDPRTAKVPVAIVTSATLTAAQSAQLARARAILSKSELSAGLLKELLEPSAAAECA